MDLKNDEDLIIKESDKGSACVMDKEYYKNKIELMLQDESTYKEINNNNRNKETLNKIKLTREYANNLTKKEIDYITNFDYRPSIMYGLLKVHKCKKIIDAIKQRPAECIKNVRHSETNYCLTTDCH